MGRLQNWIDGPIGVLLRCVDLWEISVFGAMRKSDP